jgi:O-antigen/teichoic acid export membrane protein
MWIEGRVRTIAMTQFAWRLTAGILAIASAVLVSVTLGLATQGVVATTVTAANALSVLTGSGFTHVAAFAAAQPGREASAGLRRSAVLSAWIGGIVGLVVAVIGSVYFWSSPVLWWSLPLALPFFQFGQFGLGLQQGLGSARGYVRSMVAPTIAMFGTAVAGAILASHSDAPTWWAWPLIVLPPVFQAATVIPAWRRLPPSPTRSLRPLLRYTAGIYPSAVAHLLSYRLDLILVGALLGATAAGIYSLALNGVDAVARIGQTAATVLFRRFREPDGASIARRAALATGALSLAVSLVLALGVLAISGRVGSEARTIGLLLLLLAGGGAGVSAWTVLASYLAATARLSATARVNLVVVATSVVLYGSLIPVVGVYGGAIGTTVGLLIASALGYWESGRPSRIDASADGAATLFRNPLGK